MTPDLLKFDMVAGFVGATLIIPILQQPRFSDRTRAIITFVYCLLMGTVGAWLAGKFRGNADVMSWIASVVAVLAAAIPVYTGFAKKVGFAPWLEAVTSPGPPAADRYAETKARE